MSHPANTIFIENLKEHLEEIPKPVQWKTFEERNGMKPIDWLIYGKNPWEPKFKKTDL